jgi:hypothetical protein
VDWLVFPRVSAAAKGGIGSYYASDIPMLHASMLQEKRQGPLVRRSVVRDAEDGVEVGIGVVLI